MQEKRFFILLFLVPFCLFSQIKGIVTDSLTGNPIPYVNIWVENENIGTTSNENGVFFIDFVSKKKLVFSSLGYHSKTTLLNSTNKVVLIPKEYFLEELVLTGSRNTKQIEIGTFNKKTNMSYAGGKLPWIVANYFPSNETIEAHSFVKKVTFQTKSTLKKVKMILHFYASGENGLPTHELTESNIIVEIDKGKQTNIIDVSEHKIQFPKTGLFVAFEWLIIDENKVVFTYTDSENKKHKDGVFYEPKIICFLSDEENMFLYSKGNWKNTKKKFNTNTGFKKLDNKIFETAINLTLSN